MVAMIFLNAFFGTGGFLANFVIAHHMTVGLNLSAVNLNEANGACLGFHTGLGTGGSGNCFVGGFAMTSRLLDCLRQNRITNGADFSERTICGTCGFNGGKLTCVSH